MEPKCCPPMGDGSAPVRVRRRTPSNVRDGAPGCARSAPALRAGHRRVALAQELHCMLRTMESDLHGPITVPVVVRDGARSRASRAFVEADPGLTSLKCEVGQFNP